MKTDASHVHVITFIQKLRRKHKLQNSPFLYLNSLLITEMIQSTNKIEILWLQFKSKFA